jgi:hypothetical protein
MDHSGTALMEQFGTPGWTSEEKQGQVHPDLGGAAFEDGQYVIGGVRSGTDVDGSRGVIGDAAGGGAGGGGHGGVDGGNGMRTSSSSSSASSSSSSTAARGSRQTRAGRGPVPSSASSASTLVLLDGNLGSSHHVRSLDPHYRYLSRNSTLAVDAEVAATINPPTLLFPGSASHTTTDAILQTEKPSPASPSNFPTFAAAATKHQSDHRRRPSAFDLQRSGHGYGSSRASSSNQHHHHHHHHHQSTTRTATSTRYSRRQQRGAQRRMNQAATEDDFAQMQKLSNEYQPVIEVSGRAPPIPSRSSSSEGDGV